MTDRENLIELLNSFDCPRWDADECTDRCNARMADHLIANGVRVEEKQATREKGKRIEELETELEEREKVVIQLRKQWQDAEMHICTMCGHFAHKRDGGVTYGNRSCGELVGYPYCAGKFTPWIPVTERLPENCMERVLVKIKDANNIIGHPDMDTDRFRPDGWVRWGNLVTHWMPLPDAPKEGDG